MITISKRCSPIRPWCQVSTALAIIALLGASHVALAQQVNRKVYPGTFCQPGIVGGDQPPNVQYDGLGRILNRSVGGESAGVLLEVICPVVRDEIITGTAGIRDARVRIVKATDASPPGEAEDTEISCTLFSRTLFGAEAPVAIESVRDSGPPGTRSLFFGQIRSFNQVPGSTQPGSGYYYFRCFIPGALGDPEVESQVDNCELDSRCSGIISYRVDEIVTPQAQIQESPEADEEDL
jgi:hypothetical protein